MLVFVMVFAVVGASSFPNRAEAGKRNTSCAANTDHVGGVDQEQCRYDGGLSARTPRNNQRGVWQSFTAGVSGWLTEVDIGLFGNLYNTIDSSLPLMGTLGVYEGEGTHGTLLAAVTTQIECAGGDCMIPFFLSRCDRDTGDIVGAYVVAGAQYTFSFTPGSGMPDPYGVQVGAHNPYHSGTLGYSTVIPGNDNVISNYDMVFTSWVDSFFCE